MSFILKMAWRDSRASRRRLMLFSLSVVLGIAALVAIGSFSSNLRQAIDDQAKGLLGADLLLTSRNEPSEAARAYLTEIGAERAYEIGFSSMMVFPAANNLTRLVQVRALEGNYPFYGEVVTVPPDAFAQFRAVTMGRARRGSGEDATGASRSQNTAEKAAPSSAERNAADVVLLEETLMRQFNTKPGDMVKLGQTMFTVLGALQKMPGEGTALAATFAPRALIPMRALDATGLAGKASLIRHRTMLLLPPERNPEVVEREMRRRFRSENFGFDTVEERKRNLGRALENIEGFLSLVGFIALFLGAIGVASAIHVYVRQKITTVAVLRCLGASARQSFGVYLVQGFALGVFGATVGAALGVAVQLLLPQLLRSVLPFDVDFFIAWPAVLRGMGAGLVICLLFTLLPLLAVRRVSPLVALRSAYAERADAAPDPWRIAIGVFIVAAVTGFSIWQTARLRDGLGFAGMLFVGFGVLAGAAKLVAWAAQRWFPRRMPFVVRQGVANLYRPNNRTVLLLVSLGLGTFLMLTLFLTRTTLLREVELTSGGGRPNLLFFDIQDDQIEPLAELMKQRGAPVAVRAPIVTMKISSVKGRKVDELLRTARGWGAEREDGDKEKRKNGGRERRREAEPKKKSESADDFTGLPAWTLRREYRSTYRGKLEGSERLVAGEFVGRVAPGAAVVPISIEEGLFKEMRLKVGDEIEWDVQGVPLRTRVSSVRTVEWRRLEPNFFVVFPLGVLEPAPKFHVAAVRAASTDASAQLQRAAVEAFPNVTAIDLALVMQTVDAIFSKVAFVIEFMALFTMATGLIVLVGAVLTGRFQRIRETVLLRTLGATRRQLLQIQLVEYAVLGLIAALLGCALAVIGNALLAKFIFRITPMVPLLLVVAGALAVSIVTVITGLLTSRGITNHPPLEVLRQEV